VAALGILVYAAFFFALIKLIPVTLTLPGIAGLILTIGVAADSNVVIFERIKEEARLGRSMPAAIATGYRKGISTIIDANVIILLTAFILFVLATAGVKGFAFALGVGTLVSLFTAIVFTQAVLGALGRAKFLSSPKLLGASERRVSWRFDWTGLSKWFFSISGAILAIGAISFTTNQLNFGIDFESGTQVKVSLAQPVDVEEVRTSLAAAGAPNADGAKIQQIQEEAFGDNVVEISTQELAPDQVGVVQTQLSEDFGLAGGDDGFESNSVGPTFGEQIATSAVLAVIFSLILIAAYMAFRFEAKYSVPVMIAVVHDILITAGVYSLSGREVSSATVAAFLTILGYSLYDTVIVFDRIRENVPRLPRAAFSQIVNRSMSEVLTRSLITGLSTVFLIAVILVFGGDTLGDFAFAMMIGVLSGTYSSIFIASPVLTAWKEREHSFRLRRYRIEESMGYVPAYPEDNVVAKLGDDDGGDDPLLEAPDGEGAALVAAAAAAEAQVVTEGDRKGLHAPDAAIAAPAPSRADVELPQGAVESEAAPANPDTAPSTPESPDAESKKDRESQRKRRQQRSRRKHGRHR
jgi:SecD/SecF fusion protein